MEIWAMAGFVSVVVVTFFVLMWLTSLVIKRISITAGGLVMLTIAMVYTAIVTAYVCKQVPMQ